MTDIDRKRNKRGQAKDTSTKENSKNMFGRSKKQTNELNTDNSKIGGKTSNKMKANDTDAFGSKIDESEEDKNNSKNASSKAGQSKIQIKTVDQLLLHASDTAVKPIIGKEVEELPNLEYESTSFTFKVLSVQEVANNIDSESIEVSE